MVLPARRKSMPHSQLPTTNFKHCRFCRPTSVPSVGSSIVSHLPSSSNNMPAWSLEIPHLLRFATKLYWRGCQEDLKSWVSSGPQQSVNIKLACIDYSMDPVCRIPCGKWRWIGQPRQSPGSNSKPWMTLTHRWKTKFTHSSARKLINGSKSFFARKTTE